MSKALVGEVIPPRKGGKVRSARWYLKRMADIREQAEHGLRSSADAQRLHSMTGQELEAFLSVQILEINGQDRAINIEPDEAEEYRAPRVTAHRVKKVTAKSGTDRHGGPINEKTVRIETSANDDDAEIEAEIEALE